MTTTNTTTTTATPCTTPAGTLAWRKTMVGPRGGQTTMYCPRAEGQTEPSPWVIWSWRLRDVDTGDVVGHHDFR
jgi:hypothetical protein